jgi:hypothetical protein
MDPNQAWLDLASAIDDDDWDRASEIADDLLEWLTKGGFTPKVTGQPTFDGLVVRCTCEGVAVTDSR